MIGECDHCHGAGGLADAGHGILLCAACRRAEREAAGTGKFVNQHGRTRGRRNAYPGERRGPLDRGQKARLCILAAEAFAKMHGRLPAPAELDAWRRVQQEKACGFASLTHASQAHYAALEAHFLDLKGESGRAFERLMRPELTEQRRVLAVLRRNLRERGMAPAYAAAIARRVHRCELEEASVRQLWQIIFTVRNRRKATRP